MEHRLPHAYRGHRHTLGELIQSLLFQLVPSGLQILVWTYPVVFAFVVKLLRKQP